MLRLARNRPCALSGVEMGLLAAGVPHRSGGVQAAMASLEGRSHENAPLRAVAG